MKDEETAGEERGHAISQQCGEGERREGMLFLSSVVKERGEERLSCSAPQVSVYM
jgi:hypothetical protein